MAQLHQSHHLVTEHDCLARLLSLHQRGCIVAVCPLTHQEVRIWREFVCLVHNLFAGCQRSLRGVTFEENVLTLLTERHIWL